MDAVFLKLLNMSITAGWLILAVAALRLVLKKAPKWMRCALWGLVGLRLIFPFSIESALSLIPSAETISPDIGYSQTPGITSGIPALNQAVNPIISESLSPTVGASVNPVQIWTTAAGYVWLAGIAVMLIYTAISYLRLRRKVDTAVLLRDNIWQSENVNSPFILGLLRPRIYLPFHMTDEEMANVLAHENAHLKRRDHLIKPLAFLLLTVYWFNPLVWLAYVLLCRDIELACDERVVKDLGEQARRDYGAALLVCSVSRKSIAACPLAFGEVGVKERIKTVLNYKKPAFWIVVVAVVACVVVAVCFLTNPRADYTSQEGDAQGIGVRILSEVSVGSEKITIEWVNSTPHEAVYGDAYDIEYLENGEWISCAVNEVVFHMPAYSLRPRNSAQRDYSLTNYDLTQPGKYRFSANCHFDKDKPITEEESFTVWTAFTIEANHLSLNDVIMLSEKGEALTWSDFDSYSYTDIGSGLYIYRYEIDSHFSLRIGGGSINVTPMYILLVSEANPDDYIDIRTESVTDFIEAHRHDFADAAIRAAVLEYNRGKYLEGDFACESHVILAENSGAGESEGSAFITFYTVALYQEYVLSVNAPVMISGGCVPTALTFDVTDGEYTLTEYWEPGDGAYYELDLREKFPESIVEDAIAGYEYSDALVEACDAQVREYFAAHTASVAVVTDLLSGDTVSVDGEWTARLAELIASGKWGAELPALDPEYEITIGDDVFYSDYGLGVLVDNANSRCLILTDADSKYLAERLKDIFE